MAMRSSYIGIPWLSLAEMATSSLHDRGPLPSSSDLILLVFPSQVRRMGEIVIPDYRVRETTTTPSDQVRWACF